MAPNKGMTQAALDQMQQKAPPLLLDQPMHSGGSNYPPPQGVTAADWGNAPRPWAFGMPAESSDTRGVLAAPPQASSGLMSTQRNMLMAATADYYGQQQAGSPRPPWASMSGTLNRTGTLPPIPNSPTRSRLMMSLPPPSPGAFGPSSPLGGGGGDALLSRTLPGRSSGLSRTLMSLNSSLGPYGTPIGPPEDTSSASSSRVQPSVTGLLPSPEGGRVPPTPTTTKSRMMPLPSPLGGGGGVGGVESGTQAAAYGPPKPLSIALPESPKGP